MRLIDADPLEFSYFAHIENYSIHPEYSEDYKRGFNDAVMRDIGIINNAPTIDPNQKLIVVPSEVIKQVADCVVNTINNIDWSKAIDAYKDIDKEANT